MKKKIFVLPIIDGREPSKATEFILNNDVANLKFYVIDSGDREFAEKTIGDSKSLSVRFSDSLDRQEIFSKCEVRLVKVHSEVDDITELEYRIIKQS
jgi:hypothetical protein